MKIMIIKKSLNETTKEIFNRITIVEENLEIKNNKNTVEKRLLIILSLVKVHNKIVSKKVGLLVNVVMMKLIVIQTSLFVAIDLTKIKQVVLLPRSSKREMNNFVKILINNKTNNLDTDSKNLINSKLKQSKNLTLNQHKLQKIKLKN